MSEINLFNDENDFRSENQNLSNNAGQSDDVQFESYLQNNDNSNGIDESDNDSLSDEAKRLVAVMNFEGMNLSQFSQALGIKISTLSHLVNGRNRPSLDIMQRALRRFTYLTADWLILGRGEEPFGVKSQAGSSDEIDFHINQKPDNEINADSRLDIGANGNDVKLEIDESDSKATLNESVDESRSVVDIDKIVSRVVESLRHQMVDKHGFDSETHPSENERTPISEIENNPMQIISQQPSESRAEIRERVKPVVTKIIVFYSDNTFEQFTK